jgi:hypothetical protein
MQAGSNEMSDGQLAMGESATASLNIQLVRIGLVRSKAGSMGGALTIRPPTNRARDISTQTKRPPDKPSAVTIYYCDIRPPMRSVHVFFFHPAFKVDGLSLVT